MAASGEFMMAVRLRCSGEPSDDVLGVVTRQRRARRGRPVAVAWFVAADRRQDELSDGAGIELHS